MIHGESEQPLLYENSTRSSSTITTTRDSSSDDKSLLLGANGSNDFIIEIPLNKLNNDYASKYFQNEINNIKIDKKFVTTNGSFNKIVEQFNLIKLGKDKNILLAAFDFENYEQNEKIKNDKEFSKRFLAELADRQEILLFKDFVNKLYEIDRFKSICDELRKYQDDVLKEWNLNRFDRIIPLPNRRIVFDEHGNILLKRTPIYLLYKTTANQTQKQKQIQWFKDLFNHYQIDYIDMAEEVLKIYNNLRLLHYDELVFEAKYPIIILWDNDLDEAFDEEKNLAEDNLVYRLIGRKLFKEYLADNNCINKRFYTCLINNCTSCDYYFIQELPNGQTAYRLNENLNSNINQCIIEFISSL